MATSNRGPYPDYRGGSEGYWEYCQRAGEVVVWLTAPNPCRGGVQFVFAGSSSALVGAGSVVTGDVPAHGLVVGNPARRIGWVCACGERLPDELRCGCGRRYRRIGEVQGLAPL